MLQETLVDKFKKLPLPLKIIGVGSAIALISTVLPWYQDIDTFNTGDKFLGLNGPLYLLGVFILILASASLALVVMKALNKKLPKFIVSEDHAYIFAGAVSLFLLVIASSIYFHPKFGVNITMKEMRFGMGLSFLGNLLILSGGILKMKKKGVSFEVEGKLDKLIDINVQDRTAQDINPHTEREQKVFEVEEIAEEVVVRRESNNDNHE